MSTAIKVENLSKAYQLGEIGTGTISRDIERWWHKIRGKEDPFLKVGETNDRTQEGNSDIVWSLKDINFQINQGDAVGIIGRNGAGKSTLLKILSQVTSPTTGIVSGKGRIASLLEVGTGFHPELTGRENIYLNGAILGMRKREISRKFDEIVDFAGVHRYIDTPVKRYSSGMYVRLAFAVAAHLESEILIVDEVLAVGDSEFQQKCLGKMGDISKGEGRTVLFVSHNMASIKTLCDRGILLKNGTLIKNDSIDNVIRFYMEDKELQIRDATQPINSIYFVKVSIYSLKDGIKDSTIRSGDDITIDIELNNLNKIINPYVGIFIKSLDENIISAFNDRMLINNLNKSKSNKQIRRFIIPDNRFNSGVYHLTFVLADSDINRVDEVEGIKLEIFGSDIYNIGLELDSKNYGYYSIPATCNIINLE